MSKRERRLELVDEAMRALRSQDCRARRWSISLAARYRRMTGPPGVYTNAAKFSELRQVLRSQWERAKELARDIRNTTAKTEVALRFLLRPSNGYLIDQTKIDEVTWRRREIANQLESFAAEVNDLVLLPSWPQGGQLNLAKAALGAPKQWLVHECLIVFWHYGDRTGIRPLSSKEGSPFGDYVGAVYELGTGEDPWDENVGLDKVVNEFARQWRRNEKSPQPPSK
jgi:hypothetical protein